MQVHRGEVFDFLGPNGAGKTTAIGLLLGLLRPTAEVMGHDIRRQPAQALRRVGALVEAAFYPYISTNAPGSIEQRRPAIPAPPPYCFRVSSVFLRKRSPAQSSVLFGVAKPPFLC